MKISELIEALQDIKGEDNHVFFVAANGETYEINDICNYPYGQRYELLEEGK